jgi:hypothetical protein
VQFAHHLVAEWAASCAMEFNLEPDACGDAMSEGDHAGDVDPPCLAAGERGRPDRGGDPKPEDERGERGPERDLDRMAGESRCVAGSVRAR